ncbi:uncharacterized protein LOC118446644 [Vespa mandarinia]|uniref:uncharacterized protein LOC118446644 n=1 Tax=Vespa mandarinia TaxID=7446 RepID=UPI0016076D67|nr:uncharacterized protein LOC118446644 [Vespa mandarinia]
MLSKEEDYIDNEYYTMNRQFFRLIGLWQGQTSFKNIIYVYFINLILTFASIGQIQLLFTSERNLMSITKLLEMLLPTLCFSCCYCNLLLNDRVMKKILFRIKSDWDDLADKPELMIVKKYAEISRICTIIIAVCFYIYIVFLIFPSLLSVFRYVSGDINETELILPIRADYFLKNLMVYYIGLIIQYVIIIVTCTVGIANYSMFIAIVQHACALFSIVQWRVKHKYEKLAHNSYYINVESELTEENGWIVHLIKFYKRTIDIIVVFIYPCRLYLPLTESKELRSSCILFVPCLYRYYVITGPIISCGFNFILNIYSGPSSAPTRTTNCTISRILTFHLACQFPFYSLSLRNQKLLLFLTMYSMRLCGISLMGAVFISHELFATVKYFLNNYIAKTSTKQRILFEYILTRSLLNLFLSLWYCIICNEFNSNKYDIIDDHNVLRSYEYRRKSKYWHTFRNLLIVSVRVSSSSVTKRVEYKGLASHWMIILIQGF